MALLDPYVGLHEYKRRTGVKGRATEANITEVLKGIDRLIDDQLDVSDGYFNDGGTQAFTFDGNGRSLLYLRDSEGRAYALRGISSEGVKVDENLDGVYETTFDLGDAWLRGLPANAAAHSRPFYALELIDRGTGVPLLIWPRERANIQITSTTWGYAQVPDALTSLIVITTRHMLEIEQSGPLFVLENIDTAIQLTPGAPHLLNQLRRHLARRRVAAY